VIKLKIALLNKDGYLTVYELSKIYSLQYQWVPTSNFFYRVPSYDRSPTTYMGCPVMPIQQEENDGFTISINKLPIETVLEVYKEWMASKPEFN
jgi:hypothetical protein